VANKQDPGELDKNGRIDGRLPWFEFRIEETEGRGVEIEKLTRVFQDLASAFYSVARARLGKPSRPGPHTPDEQALASIRILRVSPGSTVIEAEPPTGGFQGELAPFGDQPSADDVAHDLLQEMQRIDQGEPSIYRRPDVRRHIQSLIKGAAEIGRVAEAVHRPRRPFTDAQSAGELRVRLRASAVAEDIQTAPIAEPRRRRVAGHAYMVDVEPGRWRIRLKLPDGQDITLDASSELADVMKQAVDRVVEIESIEELVGDVVSSRTAVELHLLPSAGAGSLRPPKLIEELAAEQGMPANRPDYEVLATAVWQSDEDLADFESHLDQIRRAGAV
jgi:hypothetical protein